MDGICLDFDPATGLRTGGVFYVCPVHLMPFKADSN